MNIDIVCGLIVHPTQIVKALHFHLTIYLFSSQPEPTNNCLIFVIVLNVIDVKRFDVNCWISRI